MKVFIPVIDIWNAKQLTKDNYEDFKKFVSYGGATNIEDTCRNGVLRFVTFYWNPYGYDYPDHVTVNVGQYFIYNDEEPVQYQILNCLKKEWIQREE